MVRRVGTQPVDPVSIPGGARHFQCVNDIGVSVLFLHTGLCPLPLPSNPHRVYIWWQFGDIFRQNYQVKQSLVSKLLQLPANDDGQLCGLLGQYPLTSMQNNWQYWSILITDQSSLMVIDCLINIQNFCINQPMQWWSAVHLQPAWSITTYIFNAKYWSLINHQHQ